MTRTIIAAMLVLGLAACNREASNAPESTTETPASTPATTPEATPPPAETPPAATPESTTPESTTGAMGTEAGTMGAEAGTSMGAKTDATLDADLLKCDAMEASEQATCRTDAQARYEQRVKDASGTK